MNPTRRCVLSTGAAFSLSRPGAESRPGTKIGAASEAWPSGSLQIETGIDVVDQACKLATRTLMLNVSEKWGRICPVAAPAWSTHYPAWIHPFDNFWMNHVTPYLHSKESVTWPVELFSMYQRPTGMVGWGVHDTQSPEQVKAEFVRRAAEDINKESAGNRYLRDHFYIMQVCDLWDFFGDNQFGERLLPSCQAALNYMYKFKDLDGDGLVEAAAALDDVDLGTGIDRTDANACEKSVDQTMLFGALTKFARMADALGKGSQARDARGKADSLKNRFNELFWNDAGFYMFAINARTHEPVLGEHATTHANGYAVLWGLSPPERVPKLLEYFTSWDFVVPGPVFLPPVAARGSNVGREVDNRRGVYANGGCGWGRGHMPSFCLSLYRNGNPTLATDYLERLAKAAITAGSFHEYWTWEKYTGSTVPSGCEEYSETTSGFVDGVIHGYFGLEKIEPGWKSLKFSPQPTNADRCSLTLALPEGAISASFYKEAGRWRAQLQSKVTRKVEVRLPDGRNSSLIAEGGKITTV